MNLIDGSVEVEVLGLQEFDGLALRELKHGHDAIHHVPFVYFTRIRTIGEVPLLVIRVAVVLVTIVLPAFVHQLPYFVVSAHVKELKIYQE